MLRAKAMARAQGDSAPGVANSVVLKIPAAGKSIG
jgi:hypothetical protein